MTHPMEPPKQGLYDPAFERDACGVAFVADLQARKSHDIVKKALEALVNLDHRGACGCETNTGDGAGILLQMPHRFLEREASKAGFKLPAYGDYGAGMLFLPPDAAAGAACEALIEKAVLDEGQKLLGWRTVPTSNATLGPTARAGEPKVRQVFVGRAAGLTDPAAFERKLFVIRRRAENAVKASRTRRSCTRACCAPPR